MVDDNKQLATRIDADIKSTQEDVNPVISRIELVEDGDDPAWTDISTTTSTNGCNQSCETMSLSQPSASNTIFCEKTESDDEVSRLREENLKLEEQNRCLQLEVDELKTALSEQKLSEETELKTKVKQLEYELQRSNDALTTLKTDRKRLKAEKFDLLNQMKQLYHALEDKEKELRDFIRNYEQRMKEGEQQLQQNAIGGDDRSPSTLEKQFPSKEDFKRVLPRHVPFASNDGDDLTTRSSSFCIKRAETTDIGLARLLPDESTEQMLYGQSTSNYTVCPEYSSDIRESTSSGRINGFHQQATTTTTTTTTTTISSPHDHLSMDASKSSPSPPIDAEVIYANTSAMSPMAHDSTSTLDVCQSSALSRSAEELTHMLGTLDLKRKSGTLQRRTNGHGSKGGTWGSISKVFSRGRNRRSTDPSIVEYDKRTSWSPHNSLCASPLTEEIYGEKLRLLDEARVLPMDAWRASMVQAWLELSMGMHQYGPACAENIKSGKVLLELNDAELEIGLRMSNPMHRRKLRLAIEEFREPASCKYPKASELSHVWVCNEWLPGLGLVQYVDAFALHLVDARVLDYITKKDMEKYLGITRKFHQASLSHGIQLLRMVGFDQQILAERRSMCEQTDGDPLVWTNQRFIQWARSIDLAEYADNLRNSGVHGAIVVLEPSFTHDTMATALGIPQSKNIIRRHLTTEMESIIIPARVLLEQEYFHDRQLTKKDKYSIGSLGRNFSQSYASNLPGSDGRRSSLRGSLTRALGLKVKQDLQRQQQQLQRQNYSSASTHHLSNQPTMTTVTQQSSPLELEPEPEIVYKIQRPRSSQIPTRSKPPVPSNRVSSAPPGASTPILSNMLTAPTSSITAGGSGGSSRSTPTAGHRSNSSTSSSPSAASSVNTTDVSHRRIRSNGDIETITTGVTSV